MVVLQTGGINRIALTVSEMATVSGDFSFELKSRTNDKVTNFDLTPFEVSERADLFNIEVVLTEAEQDLGNAKVYLLAGQYDYTVRDADNFAVEAGLIRVEGVSSFNSISHEVEDNFIEYDGGE